ncbi:MAG: acylphosphatase [Rhodospirillales bacterium]
MNELPRRVRLLIDGRVQGVGYRWWFETRARELGVAGWVRNLRDGKVEAEIQGMPDAVSAAISAAGNGPPVARVTSVGVTELDADPEIRDFSRMPTV